jgi:hypothetical protein
VLHCDVKRCTVLYCTVLHSAALLCTVLHRDVLCCTVLHCTALHCTALHCTVLHCSPSWCATSLSCIELHRIVPLYCVMVTNLCIYRSQLFVYLEFSRQCSLCQGREALSFPLSLLFCSVLFLLLSFPLFYWSLLIPHQIASLHLSALFSSISFTSFTVSLSIKPFLPLSIAMTLLYQPNPPLLSIKLTHCMDCTLQALYILAYPLMCWETGTRAVR